MKGLIYTIILAIILSIMIGCKAKTVFVPVESVKTEYRDRLERDSVYLHDSVFVERWKSNDTVFLTKEKYKYLYRDKLVRDTIRKDSIVQIPYPVIEIKEVNKLRNWQIIFMCLGGVLIGYLGFRLFRLFK